MELSLYESLHQQLGDLTWPLLICAFLTLMILLERFAILLPSLFRRQSWLGELRSGTLDESCDSLLERLKDNRGLISCGAPPFAETGRTTQGAAGRVVVTLAGKGETQTPRRAQVAAIHRCHQPASGFASALCWGYWRCSTILAPIRVTVSLRPCWPRGLGLAMYTTAAGLLIAVPALLGAQLFGLWAERSVASCAHVLNQLNLWLEGVPLQGEDNDYAAFNLTKLSQINGKRRHPEPLS